MHSESINGNRSTSSTSTDAAHCFAGNNRQAKQNRQHRTKPLTKLKVLIVHRIPVIQFALSTLISASARFVVCGETDSAPNARELFDRHRPDLIVLGLTLQSGDGIGLIKDFHKSNPAVHCVVLTMRDDPLSMQRAFRAGASGYLVAQDDITEILEMLDQALDGELHASDNVCRALLKNLARSVIEPVTSDASAERARAASALSYRTRFWRDATRGRTASERENNRNPPNADQTKAWFAQRSRAQRQGLALDGGIGQPKSTFEQGGASQKWPAIVSVADLLFLKHERVF